MSFMLQTAALVAAAYATPVLFGLGVYLAFARNPQRVEAAAVSWGAGWATVNLVTFTANQVFGARLDGTFYAVTAATLAAAGLGLVAFRRDRLRGLLGRPLLPPDLKSGFGFAALVLLSGFLLLVVYKGIIVWPAAADALIYHMVLPKEAFQSATLPFHAGIDMIDIASTYPDLLVTQQLWIYLGTATFDSAFVRPIVPVYAILLFVLMFFDVRRWFGLATALTAAAALASIQGLTATTTILFDEVPLAFYGYLALRLAVDASQQHGSWIPSGIFAGCAGLVKYQGIAAFAALGVALLVEGLWSQRAKANHTPPNRWHVPLKRLLGFSVAGLAVTAVFLARNMVALANPFYPYFFGGVDTQATAYYYEIFTPDVITQIWGFEAVALLSTLVIGCLLLGLFRVRAWTKIERLLFLSSVFYLPPYLYYPLPSQHMRYLAPVLPAMAVFGGRQLVWWSREARTPQKVATPPNELAASKNCHRWKDWREVSHVLARERVIEVWRQVEDARQEQESLDPCPRTDAEQAQEQTADDQCGQERDGLEAPDLRDDIRREDLVVVSGCLGVHTPEEIRVEGICQSDHVTSQEHRSDCESCQRKS